ncbi:hypothetical protein ACFL3Q_11405 [Planctomycetota bacterium]
MLEDTQALGVYYYGRTHDSQLPLKDSLTVREGPACRFCGCAP